MFDRMKREKIYYFGIVAAGFAFLLRYIIGILQHTKFNDFVHISSWEWGVYTFCFIWLCIAVWNLLRTRCTSCHSPHFRLTNTKELDRWLGTKKVSERISDNTYATRVIPVTKREIQHAYQCEECGNMWTNTRTEVMQ